MSRSLEEVATLLRDTKAVPFDGYVGLPSDFWELPDELACLVVAGGAQ